MVINGKISTKKKEVEFFKLEICRSIYIITQSTYYDNLINEYSIIKNCSNN